MIAFLGIMSLLVFIIFGVLFIVSLSRKKNRKRNALIMGVSFVLFIFFIIIDSDGVGTVDNSQDDDNKKVEEEKEDKEEQDKKDKKEQDKKDKEEQDKKDKEEQDKKDKEESVKDIDEEMENYDGVKSAEIHDGELTITYEPGMVWSENSLFGTVYDSFEVTNQAFKDDSVDSVVNLIKGEMMDKKGNEELKDLITYRYYRSDFEELNYSKFKEMAIVEKWRILNEADGYFIHPGVRVKLKAKYTDNLK